MDNQQSKFREYIYTNFRHLLRFGEVSQYLGYNALVDFFPRMPVKPNPDCDTDGGICKRRQKEFQEAEEKRKREQVQGDPSRLGPG